MLSFWRFSPIDTIYYNELGSDYNYTIVFISLCVAILASYSALTVLERVWSSCYQHSRRVWLWFGAAVMGVGIWAMHFTGMMAHMIPVAMHYDPIITMLSVIPAVIGSYFSLQILSQRLFSFAWIQIAGFSLATGIVFMHFIGMEAMVMDVLMHYDFSLFIASFLAAHVLASLALHIRILFNDRQSPYFLNWRVFSALIMGAAVVSMHYVGMLSISFYVDSREVLSPVPKFMSENVLTLSLILVAVNFVLMAITVVGSIIDKRLELAREDIADRSAREKLIVDALADGLIVINEGGRIETFNASAAVIFNQRSSEVIGKKIETLIPEISYSQLSEDCEKCVPNMIGNTVQLKGIKSDGHWFPVEVTFSRVSASPQLVFTAVIRDITHRKELEDQVRQAHKLESMGQLAAGIAHEINTPTQYISDNAHFLKNAFNEVILILRQCQGTFGDEKNVDNLDASKLMELRGVVQSTDIDFIVKEIPLSIDQSLEGLKRVAKITSAMKYFSHKSSDKKELTNLREAVEATVTVARNEWKYVAEMEYFYEDNLPLVPCHRDEFNQVILNLVVNAAHAISDKSKSNAVEKGKITISIKTNDGYVAVSIEDNGIGIPEEIRDKIFDQFFTTKEVGRGTGQGLSMAYSIIVDGHGGDILVSSQEGKGTIVDVILPLFEVDALSKYTEAV